VYRKQGHEEEAKKALRFPRIFADATTRKAGEKRIGQKLIRLREDARTICEKLYDPDNAEKLTRWAIYGKHGDGSQR